MTPWLARIADKQPTAPALYADGARDTYAELAGDARRRADVLAELGLTPASRVAVLADNSAEFVRAAHAVFWLGATLVPLNTRLTDTELTPQLLEVAPDIVLTDQSRRALANTPERTRSLPLDELAARASRHSGATPPAEVRENSIATIFYTSGTTGRPKAVPLTWANHLASVTASAANLGVLSHDRWLCCLPLYHVGGFAIVLRSLANGTAVDLMADFDAEEAARRLDDRENDDRKHPLTLASFVPTMLRRVFEAAPNLRATSLRAALLGGGPVSEELAAECRRRDFPALQTWGMTETASQFTTEAPDFESDSAHTPPPERHLRSAGPPLMDARLRIVDEYGDEVPNGHTGRIEVSGPMVTAGYLHRPEENARRFRDGWFDTGDLGRLDERGFLHLETRASERIVTGGENVDPSEVEAVLRQHPSVRDAAVVGLEHPEWGHQVAAAVALGEDGRDTDHDLVRTELDTLCRRQLADFKRPRRWLLTDTLPRTAAHKTNLRTLRRRFARRKQ